MTPADDGLPQVARSARALGVRTLNESTNPDVTATAPDEIIQPGTGGMSEAPNDPANLPPLRKPASLGGKGKDPVWEIDTTDLGPDLQFRQDGAKHVLIEPAHPMTLAEFEQALVATRSKWVRHTG
ncbi:Tse2 family ADP-ribosyltransferase toxin [Gemmata massiliana]